MAPTSSAPATPNDSQAAGQQPKLPARAMATTLFYDIGLSVIAYFVAQLLGASNYLALLTGTVVSWLRMLWVAVSQCRLDPFALFLLTLFGAGSH